MTSLIDVMVVIVVYLLISFQASAECGCAVHVDVPTAQHTTEMIEAPLVAVTGSMILVDGMSVGEPGDFEGPRLHRIDGLFNSLKQKREIWMQLHPGREAPRDVVLAIDADVPAHLVKSVIRTATASGYPSYSLMVDARPAPAAL
jgi:biopolymer transport protein ExbD